jgi:hypothetical protein
MPSYSSANLKPTATGVNIVVNNIDDVMSKIFSQIVYPTDVGENIQPYVVGSLTAQDTNGDFNSPIGYLTSPSTWFDGFIPYDAENLFNNTLPITYPE